MDIIPGTVESHANRVLTIPRATPSASVAVGVNSGCTHQSANKQPGVSNRVPQTVPTMQLTTWRCGSEEPEILLTHGGPSAALPPCFPDQHQQQQQQQQLSPEHTIAYRQEVLLLTACEQQTLHVEHRVRSTHQSDHQQLPDDPLEEGWWERASPPLFQNRSSPQQQEWRKDFNSQLSTQPDTPLRLRLAHASALTLSTSFCPHPFAIPTSQQAALPVSSYTGVVLRKSAGKLVVEQLADKFRFGPLRSPHAPDRASCVRPSFSLHSRSQSFPSRAQSRIASMFTGLTSWLRHQPLQRPKPLHFRTHDRRSTSSEGSLVPCGPDRWPCSVAAYTHIAVSACSPSSVQACMQASVQAPMQAAVQASRSKHSMEGDILALAHLTKRYSQEADSPACQLAAGKSLPCSSSEVLSGFGRAPTPHMFVSAYSRGGRFSLSYGTALTRHDTNHAPSLAASSLLYHTA